MLSPGLRWEIKSIMSKNVIELNKLNIFRDWFTVQPPPAPGNQSHSRIHKAALFYKQFPLVLNRFCLSHSQPIGNPRIISPDFILAGVQILLGLIQFSETQDFSQDMQVLKRNTLCEWSEENNWGRFWTTSVFLYSSWILNEDCLDVDMTFYNDNTMKCMRTPSIYPKHELLRKFQILYYIDLNCSVWSFVLWKEKQIGVNN